MDAINIISDENPEGRVDVARTVGRLMLSSSRLPAVSMYPDSDKVGVWPGAEVDELVFRRDTAVPWSDGEEGPALCLSAVKNSQERILDCENP